MQIGVLSPNWRERPFFLSPPPRAFLFSSSLPPPLLAFPPPSSRTKPAFPLCCRLSFLRLKMSLPTSFRTAFSPLSFSPEPLQERWRKCPPFFPHLHEALLLLAPPLYALPDECFSSDRERCKRAASLFFSSDNFSPSLSPPVPEEQVRPGGFFFFSSG